MSSRFSCCLASVFNEQKQARVGFRIVEAGCSTSLSRYWARLYSEQTLACFQAYVIASVATELRVLAVRSKSCSLLVQSSTCYIQYKSHALPHSCSPPLSTLRKQVYQRVRDYYGPQYDIQTGVYHQGYGDEDNYDGFWGKGSLFIDLPRSRVYDASFNCTPGFQA